MTLNNEMPLFSGKTIILGVPKHYSLDKVIEAELKDLGFNVINISFYDNLFRYKNLAQRIQSYVFKKFLGKQSYRVALAFKANRHWIDAKLANVEVADYVLMIRPDVFSLDFIKSLRVKGKKLVGYQWDGLYKFPHVLDCIGLFDRFFVFDGHDLTVPSVLPITNYYPTAFGKHMQIDEKLQFDVFYSGSYSRNRIGALSQLIRDCRSLGMRVHYHLYKRQGKDRYFSGYDLWRTNKRLDYEKNLAYVYNAQIIIDLIDAHHEGLSFRVLEGVGFDRKVITTNKKVVDYDFYHPNNILVWDKSDVVALKNFVDMPYVPLSKEIKAKYSFKNWIQYALDEGEYSSFSLPQ